MKTAYTVAHIEPNQWFIDSEGRERSVVRWDCGHRHRTIETAERCCRSLGVDSAGNRTTASLHNEVRHADDVYSRLTHEEIWSE